MGTVGVDGSGGERGWTDSGDGTWDGHCVGAKCCAGAKCYTWTEYLAGTGERNRCDDRAGYEFRSGIERAPCDGCTVQRHSSHAFPIGRLYTGDICSQIPVAGRNPLFSRVFYLFLCKNEAPSGGMPSRGGGSPLRGRHPHTDGIRDSAAADLSADGDEAGIL